LDLSISLREAIEDPSVDDAIRLLEAGVDESQNNFIRDFFSFLEGLLDTNFNGGVSFLFITNQSSRAHRYKSVSLSNNIALSSTSRAGRTKENNSWGLARSSIAESNFQHSSQFVGNLLLLFVVAVESEDELIKGVVDL
jgi:hypothetical protein